MKTIYSFENLKRFQLYFNHCIITATSEDVTLWQSTHATTHAKLNISLFEGKTAYFYDDQEQFILDLHQSFYQVNLHTTDKDSNWDLQMDLLDCLFQAMNQLDNSHYPIYKPILLGYLTNAPEEFFTDSKEYLIDQVKLDKYKSNIFFDKEPDYQFFDKEPDYQSTNIYQMLAKYPGLTKAFQRIFSYHYDQIIRELDSELRLTQCKEHQDIMDNLISFMEESMGWPSQEDTNEFIKDLSL